MTLKELKKQAIIETVEDLDNDTKLDKIYSLIMAMVNPEDLKTIDNSK